MQIHILTTEQLRKFTKAVGGLRDSSFITNDPVVNHAIECVTADDGNEPEYDEQLNLEEIEAYKEAFGPEAFDLTK